MCRLDSRVLLLCSHPGVDARTSKSLALFNLIVGKHTLVSQIFHALSGTSSFFTLLVKGFFELVQHDLEVFDILHVELGHMLLELRLFTVNLVLQFNDFLSKSQLRSNGTMEGDAEANGELQIIKTEVWAIKPFINELVKDVHIEEGKIIEDFSLLLALNQHLKSVIGKIVVT